jgi:hypothetical protein
MPKFKIELARMKRETALLEVQADSESEALEIVNEYLEDGDDLVDDAPVMVWHDWSSAGEDAGDTEISVIGREEDE